MVNLPGAIVGLWMAFSPAEKWPDTIDSHVERTAAVTCAICDETWLKMDVEWLTPKTLFIKWAEVEVVSTDWSAWTDWISPEPQKKPNKAFLDARMSYDDKVDTLFSGISDTDLHAWLKAELIGFSPEVQNSIVEWALWMWESSDYDRKRPVEIKGEPIIVEGADLTIRLARLFHWESTPEKQENPEAVFKYAESKLGIDYTKFPEPLGRMLSHGEIEFRKNAKGEFWDETADIWREMSLEISTWSVSEYTFQDMREFTPKMLLMFANLDPEDPILWLLSAKGQLFLSWTFDVSSLTK